MGTDEEIKELLEILSKWSHHPPWLSVFSDWITMQEHQNKARFLYSIKQTEFAKEFESSSEVLRLRAISNAWDVTSRVCDLIRKCDPKLLYLVPGVAFVERRKDLIPEYVAAIRALKREFQKSLKAAEKQR